MKIKACPKCGSKNISQGTLGEGVLTGYINKDVCKECGYQGMPIIFNSEKEHKKFLEGLSKDKKEKESKIKSEETVELTEKDKEVINFLKESTVEKPEKPSKQKRPYGLIILVFITIIYAIYIISILIIYPFAIFSNDIELLFQIYSIIFLSVSILSIIAIPYGFLMRKEWAYTLAGTLFILALPFGLVFLYYLTRPHVKAYFGKT